MVALDSAYADKNSFNEQKNIAKHLLARLTSQVPRYKIHIILYDGDTIPSRLFTKDDALSEIVNVIDFVPLIGGSRRIEKGLAFAAQLFKKQSTASEKSIFMKHSPSNVLVFFATGPQQKLPNGTKPKDAARELRDLAVKVVAVGTKYTPMSLLHDIGQGNAFKFPSAGFSEASFANLVSEKICGLVGKGRVAALSKLIYLILIYLNARSIIFLRK